MAALGAMCPFQVPHGSTLYPITMLGAHDHSHLRDTALFRKAL